MKNAVTREGTYAQMIKHLKRLKHAKRRKLISDYWFEIDDTEPQPSVTTVSYCYGRRRSRTSKRLIYTYKIGIVP